MLEGFSQRLLSGVPAAIGILVAMTDMYASNGTGGMPPRRRSLSRRGRVGAVVLGCAVVAGGAFAVTEAVSGGQSSPAATTTDSGGPTGQAAVLNDVLSGDNTVAPSATSSGATSAGATTAPATTAPATTAPATTAPAAAKVHARHLLAMIRDIGGEYGQFTFGTKEGTRTLAFERGTVVSLAGSDVTVRAKDGETYTWALTSASVVRDDGKKVASGTLASGDSVFAGGVISGTTRDAKLVVIR